MNEQDKGLERLSENPVVEELKLFTIAKLGQMINEYQKDLRQFDSEEDRVFLKFSYCAGF